MGSRQRVIAVLILVVIVTAIGLWYFRSDERRIRKALSQAGEALEREDLDGTMSHVSLKYRDERGWSYLIVKRLLKKGFEEFDGINIRMGRPAIEIHEEGADVQMDLEVLIDFQGEKAYLIGSSEEPASVQIAMIKETLGWRVTGVNGLRLPGMEF